MSPDLDGGSLLRELEAIFPTPHDLLANAVLSSHPASLHVSGEAQVASPVGPELGGRESRGSHSGAFGLYVTGT